MNVSYDDEKLILQNMSRISEYGRQTGNKQAKHKGNTVNQTNEHVHFTIKSRSVSQPVSEKQSLLPAKSYLQWEMLLNENFKQRCC